MKNEKKDLKYWLNEWESYVSAIIFCTITVLLITQVISRYVFNHSLTWLEELSTFLYLVMIYAAISAAVTHRKQVGIKALPDALPFKAKKVVLIFEDVVFIIFCIWIQKGLIALIKSVGMGTTALVKIPYWLCYSVVCFFLILTAIRNVQDIIKLAKEKPTELGKTAPTLDLEAYEREWAEKQAKKKEAEALKGEAK